MEERRARQKALKKQEKDERPIYSVVQMVRVKN